MLRIRMPRITLPASGVSGIFVNIAGTWKTAIYWVNVAGIWKQATAFVNVGGTWRQL